MKRLLILTTLLLASVAASYGQAGRVIGSRPLFEGEKLRIYAESKKVDSGFGEWEHVFLSL